MLETWGNRCCYIHAAIYMYPRLRKMIGMNNGKKFVHKISPRYIILHQIIYSKFSVFHHYIILRSLKIFLEKGCRILNTYLISLFFFSKITYTYVPSFLKNLDKTEEDCRSYTNSPDGHFF